MGSLVLRDIICFILLVTSLLCILGAAEDKLCFQQVGKLNQVLSGHLL
jgi:hypothetical protein